MAPKILPCLLLLCSFHCNPSHGQCDSCHKTYPDKINVHLLPSSHLELGYLQTFQEYHDKYAVPVTDTLIEALDENPDRRYAYVEAAHFWHWWKRRTEDIRNLFREHVNAGRIEMVHGGVNSAMQQIDIAQRKLLAPLVMIVIGGSEFGNHQIFQFRGLTRALPRNVQILTLEHLDENNTILLRLEHLFEKGLHSKWSQKAKIDLKGLFRTFDVVKVTETSLGADRPIEEGLTKYRWKTDEKAVFDVPFASGEDGGDRSGDFKITMLPNTIRTFIVKYERKY